MLAPSPVRPRISAVLATSLALALAAVAADGCAGGTPSPQAASANASAPGVAAAPPRVVRVDPQSGGGAAKPPGLAALQEELQRGMHDLSAKGKPPPYFIGYEVHDRSETTVMASYGALVQSTERRTRILDADVRVGDYKLDSTHAIRSNDFDFSSEITGHPVPLPLSDDETALRTVAWSETDRRYEESAERLVKLKTQRTLKVADDDPSDDFSREKPVTYFGPPARLDVDVPAWEARLRRLSGKFRGQAEILDSDASLQATSLTLWLLNSEGTAIQTGRNYVRVFIEADARAEDGMELERFESFDAETLEGLGGEAVMNAAADSIITDLKALRRAPLAEPYAGPAILEGKAAGVFFHEIFGHRVEGHRQKSEDEGQTFAKKIGEPIMPSFVSVYDDPTLANLGGVDLNGFYRYDDEGVDARRATLVDGGILRGFLLSRSPTRGFSSRTATGAGRRGGPSFRGRATWWSSRGWPSSPDELRRLLRDEAKRQGKLYGLLVPGHLGRLHQHRARRAAGVQGAADPGLPRVGRRAARRARARRRSGRHAAVVADRILAAGDDYQTFNGYCGAESGFVPGVGDQPQPAGPADRDRAPRQGERQAAGAPVAGAAAGAAWQLEAIGAAGAVSARARQGQGGAAVIRRLGGLSAIVLSLCAVARANDAADRPAAGADKPAAVAVEARIRTNDAVVQRALQDELARSMSDLHLGDESRPYYLGYTIYDLEQASVNATLGALTASHAYRGRILRTDLRVGDPSFDNSNFEGGARVETVPIEDDYAACGASSGCAPTRRTRQRWRRWRASGPRRRGRRPRPRTRPPSVISPRRRRRTWRFRSRRAPPSRRCCARRRASSPRCWPIFPRSRRRASRPATPSSGGGCFQAREPSSTTTSTPCRSTWWPRPRRPTG